MKSPSYSTEIQRHGNGRRCVSQSEPLPLMGFSEQKVNAGKKQLLHLSNLEATESKSTIQLLAKIITGLVRTNQAKIDAAHTWLTDLSTPNSH